MLLEADVRKILVNGDQWGAWRGYQLPLSDDYVCIWAPIGTERHWKPGSFISKNHMLTYLWSHEWYTIHIGFHEDGSFAEGYCDIVLPTPPCDSTSRELVYIDLYIDVVIREDRSVYTKDQEIFDRAALRYPIVEESRQKSFEVLDWLEKHAKHWTGPFALIPQHLPRTDWETLSVEEIQEAMRSAI